MKDFRCFYGEQSLNLSLDRARNVTVIHAENGVGKTTILNAVLWCFYGETTAKFERRDDLVNHDARAKGQTKAFVEVFFEHDGARYRARRFTPGGAGGEREFVIMRLEHGHQREVDNPSVFINSVVPQAMASHFLFDGEHAEFFLGEDNRSSIRRAVQDILGCSLVRTAIADLGETATYYRKQMPSSRVSSEITETSSLIDQLTTQLQQMIELRDHGRGDIEALEQQIADIEDRLRNSAAAKQLQARRDTAQTELDRARVRERKAQDDLLRWIGERGRYAVSGRITALTLDKLHDQEAQGYPSPYHEEFIQHLLDTKSCICGTALAPGSVAHDKVSACLTKGVSAVMRDRLSRVKARLSELKSGHDKAPASFVSAKQRVADAFADIGRLERELTDVSEQLSSINVTEIAEREAARNELRKKANQAREQLGSLNDRIERGTQQKTAAERKLQTLASEDEGARIYGERYRLCETLKGRLEKELADDEKSAREVLRGSISKVLDHTSRKAFRLNMTSDYSVSLVNAAGTQLPKSSGENQLLGLAFTAALVEFAKIRANAEGYKLLKGTVAPLVLDSPFGQLDEEYRKTTAEYVPEMASQVVLMLSKSQGASGVMEALKERIGEEYILVRHNTDVRGERTPEIRQINGKDIETAIFEAEMDGTTIERVTR